MEKYKGNTYTYLYIVLHIEFHVARMQAKFCWSCLRHVKGWAGLPYRILKCYCTMCGILKEPCEYICLNYVMKCKHFWALCYIKNVFTFHVTLVCVAVGG
jgi:hypothetical protein